MNARIRVTGAVQGVGYRPFVAELANKYELVGEVKNCGGIVEIVVDGENDQITSFVDCLKKNSPEGSLLTEVSVQLSEDGEPERHNSFSGFHIVQSLEDDGMDRLPVFPPDIGICRKCLKELTDESDRRYKYPLISCTSCGPRFSILKRLPYDRENITMDVYPLCPECKSEYLSGRRRHAQTISCNDCGPQMRLFTDNVILEKEEAVAKAIDIIREGGIIGLKGVGGYQLVCSPDMEESVDRLRNIKGREKKPFAIMFPDMDTIREYCQIGEKEEEFLFASSRPIVLLDAVKSFAANVCGCSRQIGAFLPASGIHVLLTKALGPVIVTSGNLSGEPMIVSDDVFRSKFKDKVDAILYYDREILRPLDDSVLQIVKLDEKNEFPRFIRRARGYVPMPVFLKENLGENNQNDLPLCESAEKGHTLYLGYGADLKNTFSIGYGDRIIPSQFFGDMESLQIQKLQKSELAAYEAVFGIEKKGYKDNPDTKERVREIHILCDAHPAYYSSAAAEEKAITLNKNGEKDRNHSHIVFRKIQHHHAHIGSVMAENNLKKCIGVAFDGTGYGDDGTIWGSEFLICEGGGYKRAAHFRAVPIVGSDEAMKNAKVTATCYLSDAGIKDRILSADEDSFIRTAVSMGINSYPNSGMGRLFDAVSAILGICSYNSYEGECAIRLQNAAEDYRSGNENDNAADEILIKLPFADGIFDSREIIREISELKETVSTAHLAYSFHMTIASAVLRGCKAARDISGINEIALSGGVFSNRLLLRMCYSMLKTEGFVVYLNNYLPTNDSGISVGQIYLDSLLCEEMSHD